MSSLDESNDSKKEKVLVLYDFEYPTKEGRVVRLCKGEQLDVLQKTNPDWWQCRRHVHSGHNADSVGADGSALFYAPVGYLKVFDFSLNNNLLNNNKTDLNSNIKSTNSDHKKNISTIKVGLSFTNPLSSGFSTDDNSEDDHRLNQSNGALDSSKESLIEDNESCDNNSSEKVDKTDNRSDSPSDGVYANLPIGAKSGCNRSQPPIPNSKVSPIRILLNHWAEYQDSNGRKFYYNSLSRQTSWKPPRRKPYHPSGDDELMTSHSEENLTDSSSTSLSVTPNRSQVSDSPTFSPPIPKPKTRIWKKFIKNGNKSTIDSTDSTSNLNGSANESKGLHSYSLPTLPKGWTRKHNEETKELYFIRNKTNEKWFCKLDENGRLYFFEENGHESYWELPDVATNDDSSEERPKVVISSSESPNAETSGTFSEAQSPDNQNNSKKMTKLSTSQRSLLERNIKARSMAFLPVNSSLATRPNIPAILLQEDNPELRQESVISEYQPPPNCLNDSVKTTKQGVLNRTKLIEGGKRIRKNWSNCYLALTDYYLLFFKDTKSAQSGSKPEITIDLTGAMIAWCPEKSSRKNCFQVSTIAGQQVLLQEECSLICKEWFDLIKNAIIKLPNASICDESDIYNEKLGTKLKRSKSTKQYRKREDLAESELSAGFAPLTTSQSANNIPSERRKKIKERLRQFLRRRPTLESLREKGIFKDEPVFGGKLDILCLRDKQLVPKFVQQCVEAIEAKDVKADGLYRACGNLSQVQKLRFQINNDDFTGIWAEDDVHVLTGLLKMFFRDMKEPLFPCDRFDSLMNIIVQSDRKSKLEMLTKLVNSLPKPNNDTLRYVLAHLLRVKEHSDQNRMHIQNLAIVFGPTLMWPQNDSNNFALDMMLRMHQNQIIEFLLLEFHNIFE